MKKVLPGTAILALAGGFLLSLLAPARPAPVAEGARLVASRQSGWPQFRGPRRDGVSEEKGLLPRWPESGPPVLWAARGIGSGYSSPVISGDRMIITGDQQDQLILTALDRSGKVLWTAANGSAWKGSYPGARASAALSGNRIYHLNAHGRIACLDRDTGREIWSLDVLNKFGGSNLTWAISECLLVDEKAVYVTAGGKEGLVAALDKNTGATLWKSAPLHDPVRDRALESAGYASPILVEYGGRRLLIGASLNHLFCVDADRGVLQWTQALHTTYSVLTMTPVLVGDAVFMTAPYAGGGRLWRLKPGTTVAVEEVWRTELDTCQGGVVFQGGRLFGSFYLGRKGFAAVDAATGAVLFQAAEWIKGSSVWADGRFYTLGENGWMYLLEPGSGSFQIMGKFRLPEMRTQDAWAHPAILDGRLYLRYHDTLTCYDIRR